jgi:hypothetical protein
VRLILAVCLSLILSSAARGQTVNDSERVIRRMIDSGFFEGHDEKVIGVLGDAGAVLVTKILADKNLTSNTIDNTLMVIRELFADPTFVNIMADREPRTALFVFKCLDSSTNDPALKKRIADTKEYVQQRYAKLTLDQPQK